jgi:hypothetical protein
VNALALAGTVVVAYLLLRRHVHRPAWRIVGVVLIAGAPPMYAVAGFAWSEPLFILFVSAALLAIERCLDEPGRLRYVVCAGLFTALAGLTRYATPSLIITGAVVLALGNRSSSARRQRLQRAAVFLAIGGAPPVLWALDRGSFRDVFLSDNASHDSLATNVRRAVETIGEWVAPVDSRLVVRVVGAGLVIAGLLAIRQAVRVPRRAALVLFTSGYLVTLVIQATRVQYDPIGDRLLSPVVVPGVVLVLIGGEALISRLPARAGTTAMTLPLAAVAALLILIPLHRTWDRGTSMWRDGAQYTSSEWQDSSLITALRREPPPGPLYSNAPAAIAFVADLAADDLPNSRRIRQLTTEGRVVYLAWFQNEAAGTVDYLAQVQREFSVTRLDVVADGAIYRVEATS